MQTKLAIAKVFAFAIILAGGVFGGEYYVDSNCGASGTGTKDAPFKTIQEAVDAAETGSVVYVAEGVYSNGSTLCADGGYARVCVKKPLKIKGAGRGKSFILGEKGSGAAGLGEGAARCVAIEADDVEISGFTIANGYTTGTSPDAASGFGGGVYSHNRANGFVVDCTISNCTAAIGGAIACKNPDFNNERLAAVRCLVTGNRASGTVKAWCDFGASLYWCIVTRHCNDGRSPVESAPKVVNCTFDNNYCHHYFHGCKDVCNTYVGQYAYKGGAGSSSWDFFANVYFTSVKSANVAGGGAVDCVFEGDFKQFVSPLEHDFRPLASAQILTAGNSAHLSMIPEAYRTKDYDGNDVGRTSGAMCIGAITKPHEPASGILVFAHDGVVAGDKFVFAGTTNDWNQQRFYCHASKYPAFVRFEPVLADGKKEYGFLANGADSVERFPLRDGSYLLMPPPSGSLKLTLKKADNVVYANPGADPSTADGSEGKPYATLQDAVDSVPDGKYAIVRASAGEYREGGTLSDGISNRVEIAGRQVRLVSLEGAEKTFIIGADSPEAQSGSQGCGANAVRCVRAASSGAVQGFTLTRGRAGAGNDDTDANRSGGVLAASSAFQVLDCIVSNNCAGIGGVGFGYSSSHLLFARSKIIGNRTLTSKHNGAYVLLSDLSSCLVAKNFSGMKDGLVLGSGQGENVYDCTVYAEGVNSDYQGLGANIYSTGTHRNSIFAGFGAYRNTTVYGVLVDTKIRNTEKVTYVTAVNGDCVSGAGIAKFADVEGNDFRVFSDSAANGLAFCDMSLNPKAYLFMTMSLDGVVPDFSGDGKFFAGAYKFPVPAVTVSGEGISPAGTFADPVAGSKITVSATKARERPFLGFAVDGVLQEFSGTEFEFEVPASLSGTLSITAVYDNNWHVDAVNGTDDGYGTKASPLRRLSDALEKSVSGDVVHAAPGEYSEGEMTHEGTFVNESRAKTPSRVVVKSGVALVSDKGAASTFIVGAIDEADESDAGYGDGPAAVRCASVHDGGVLRGFTLTGGRTSFKLDVSDAGCGGGVFAQNGNATIEDCVITNCMALVGGGGANGLYRRCKFVDCATPSGHSPAVRYAHLINCHVTRCLGGRTVSESYRVKSCTIGPGNTAFGGGETAALYKMQSGANVDNSIIVGTVVSHKGGATYSNCLFSAGLRFDDENFATNNCRFAELEDIALDANGVPEPGSSVAVDTGDKTIYDIAEEGEKDCRGKPRFANALALDVGAYEADWKNEYSAVLGNGVKVESADPAAEYRASGVYLPSGAISLEWDAIDATRVSFGVQVTGSGTLSVTKDGEKIFGFTAADGSVVQEMAVDTRKSNWVFEYVPGEGDAGGAVLSGFKRHIGLFLFVK